MKKKTLKWIALGITAALIGTGAGIYELSGLSAEGVQAAEKEEESPSQEILTEVLEQQTVSHSSEAGKEETVYVITDASGNTDQIIVSNWLKNAQGADTLEDATTLEQIENVKGDGTYTAGKGDEIVWNAEGSDVYYQGTTDRQLPVEISLTYYLDGEEITPQELAGKSGHVTIRFDYSNHVTQTVTIGGEETELYIPFAVVSGMMLSLDRFSNVSVTNGKIISEGNHDIVVGLAFPGLKENLDLDNLNQEELEAQGVDVSGLDAEIPDYVEVSADVIDFSLDMTLSMILPDSFSTVELTDEIDFSGVSDQLMQLNDSMDILADSSTRLVGGSRELAEGADSLAAGLDEISQGSGRVLSGVRQLGDSLTGMAEQLVPAHEKFAAATQGLEQAMAAGLPEEYAYCVVILGMDSGSVMGMDPATVSGYAASAKQIYTLLGQMDAMYQAVASGSGDLTLLLQGTAQLDAGIKQASEGAAALQEGAHTLYDGMDTFDREGIQVLADAVSDTDVEGAVEFAERLSAVLDIADDYTTYSGAPEDLESSVKFIIRTGAIDGTSR